MKNRVLLFIGILFLCALPCSGQIGIGTEQPDSTQIHDIIEQKDVFQNIEQNLIVQSGKNTIEEAIEYYNLGLFFYKEQQLTASENYLKQSIEIYDVVLKKKSKFSSFNSKSTNEKVSYSVFDVKLALITVYIELNRPIEGLKLIEELEVEFPVNIDLKLKKLLVFQNLESWTKIHELCEDLELLSLTKSQNDFIINKKTLAETKLGIENDIFLTNSIDDTESNRKKEIGYTKTHNNGKSLDLDYEEFENSINTEKVEQLSYETQDEIANVYNDNNDVTKELSIRNTILKDKKISEGKKAKQKLEIGKLLQKNNKASKAIKTLEESLKLAKTSKNIDVERETLLKLIDIYKANKNDKKIIFYYDQYLHTSILKDSIDNLQMLSTIHSFNGAIEKQEAIKNIGERRALYQKEEELSQFENSLVEDQIKFQKLIIALLILGLLLLFGLLFWYHKQRKKLKLVNLQLELKNMRNQMNPHFIFNSLNAVNHFIAQRNELMANEYLTEFSLLMRNTLNQSDLDLIPLADELTFLNRYCELEKMRFESKFDFVFEVDSRISINDYKIPPLLLQPFVENAVWHGLRYLESKGELLVKFSLKNENLCIEIKDNGIGRDKSASIKTVNQKKHKSKGVNLIKRRIDISNLLTPVKIDWEINDITPNGTQVLIQLTKHKNE